MSGCGGNCGCGSSCSCGNGCTCGRNADISENGTTTQILIVGVAPAGSSFERSEMSFGSENDGCNCGSDCSCDPCTCK